MDEIRLSEEPFLADERQPGPGVRQRQRWEASRNWHYPIKNGIQDPLCVMLVLDLVMRVDPAVELRAARLVEALRREEPGYVWDAVTVGRILSDIHDAFAAALGERFGLLEGGRDWRGAFYLVHRTAEVAEVAWRIRDELMRLVEIEIDVRRQGKRTDFMGSPLIECPSARGEWREEEVA